MSLRSSIPLEGELPVEPTETRRHASSPLEEESAPRAPGRRVARALASLEVLIEKRTVLALWLVDMHVDMRRLDFRLLWRR